MSVVMAAGAHHPTALRCLRIFEYVNSYFLPGSFLNSLLAQQNYMSSNYTHVVRDVLDAGINVLVQLVSKITSTARVRFR